MVVEAATHERILLTIPEAAERLGVGKTLVWQMVARNELPSVRLGRLVRVPVPALDEWIREQTGAHGAAMLAK